VSASTVEAAEPAIDGLDLTSDNEDARQALFAQVVLDNFTAKTLDPPEDVWSPPYTAEVAGIEVAFRWGRWFATWVKLEEPPGLPEEEGRELLRLEGTPGEAGSLLYHEV
jgi:hypothetical protein